MANNLFNVVFVLGGPGAGKGTQCSNIMKVRILYLKCIAFNKHNFLVVDDTWTV